MKKLPAHKYDRMFGKKPVLGTMASESRLRTQGWVRQGCNAYDGSSIKSTPLAFWTDDDVLQYIQRYDLKIADAYGDVICEDGNCWTTGAHRTGCLFCGFGAQMERTGETRFQRLKRDHPKLYDYCMGGGEWTDNPDYRPDLTDEPDEIGWIPWNPPKLWVPSSSGLGMAYVLDEFNKLYPKDVIRYE